MKVKFILNIFLSPLGTTKRKVYSQPAWSGSLKIRFSLAAITPRVVTGFAALEGWLLFQAVAKRLAQAI